ncbi:Gti1/Pac2 family-domain-containing protein [Parasitella parasitica]|nr:Gti1/Pac2 family-domain-containing protein [Parasitella parasitica]
MPYTKTFHGFIENTTDALLIIEACRAGILPTINRRLIERERHSIKSGTIIVFDETESGIKRWTDGFLWSPSRILGSFLVYRELENREHRKINNDYNYSAIKKGSSNITNETNISLMQQRERALVSSLTTSNTTYNFKRNGLIKKTIRIMVNNNILHIVNYYSKPDALNNLLVTPSASTELACLQISADLMPHLQGHNPPEAAHSRKRSRSSDESNHSQQTRPYSKTCRNSLHPAAPTLCKSTLSYPLYNHMNNKLSTSLFSESSAPSFDTSHYHYNSKRSKASQDTLLPSTTPSPPNILSSCGDTALLASKFNQFYNPSSLAISLNQRSINNSTASNFDNTLPRRTTAFDNY